MTDVAAELRARAEKARAYAEPDFAEAYYEAASLVESSQEARVERLESLLGKAAVFLPPPHPNRPASEGPCLRDQVMNALGYEPASTEPACTGNCEPGLHDPDCPIHGHAPESKDKRLAAALRALYECYMLSGADTSDDARHDGVCATVDDHEWWRLNPSEAVEAVRELRREYDEAREELHASFAPAPPTLKGEDDGPG